MAAASGNAKAASNWVMGELTRKMNDTRRSAADVPLQPDALAELIRLIDAGSITGPVAKDVFEQMYASGRRAAEIVQTDGLGRIDDSEAIDRIVRDVLAGHAATVAEYRNGKTKTFGFLVGQVIKSTAGKVVSSGMTTRAPSRKRARKPRTNKRPLAKASMSKSRARRPQL